MLQNKEMRKERKGREERKGRKGKRRKGTRKESKKEGEERNDSDLVRNCANWLEMLPYPRIWNIRCLFHKMYDFGRPRGHQIDGFQGGLGTDFGATAIWSEIVCKLVGNATLP